MTAMASCPAVLRPNRTSCAQASCSGRSAWKALGSVPTGRHCRSELGRRLRVRAEAADQETRVQEPPKKVDPEETTKKWGLEAGLWQVFTNKDPETGKTKGQQAKDLLKRYGSAYLITSISFAIVSFAACYALVSAGVDVAALLGRIGLTVNATNEKVGTAAIAYAAHKALSPVRFPPTVALTPVVARLLGKDKDGTGGSPPPLNGNGPAP